jgi:hypothetical protein
MPLQAAKKQRRGMSRTDKEVIQNLSGGTARHEETEKRRNAFLGFFYPHIRFVISLALQCKHKEA